jgi:hypothetical protein
MEQGAHHSDHDREDRKAGADDAHQRQHDPDAPQDPGHATYEDQPVRALFANGLRGVASTFIKRTHVESIAAGHGQTGGVEGVACPSPHAG